MALKLFPLSSVQPTPESIERAKNNYLYAEDNFVTTSTLVPANNAGGGGTSTVATLPTSIPLLDVTNCLQLILSNTSANTFAARSGNIGRSFMPGQWDATLLARFIIGPATPRPVTMNNAFFYAGFASTSTLPNPATVDNASILFVYDSLGVGLRVCNGTSISTYRPASTVNLTPGVIYKLRLQVSKSTPKAEVFIDNSLILTAENVNFPAYNNLNRSLFPFVQNGRLLADSVNPAPVMYIDDIAMLLTR